MGDKETDPTTEPPKQVPSRPLTESETTHFLNYYKRLYLETNKMGGDSQEIQEKIKNLSYVDNQIDPSCVMKINKRLVRVKYPGEVKNVDRAIETLGGMEAIEMSVAEHKKKLELRFHPKNKYSKPAAADKDFKPGILIKVKKSSVVLQPCSSKVKQEAPPKIHYEVAGVSVMNFTFNRVCDFQYLPMVAKEPETKASKTEYIYDKIIPDKLPDANWFNKSESKNMEPFLLPVSFSNYDSSQMKLHMDNDDKNESKLKPEADALPSKKQKRICRIFGRNRQQISIFAKFKDKGVPTEPLKSTYKLLESRSLESQIARVKQLFDERPIWTKAAIRYNTGMTNEHSKIVLPMVAYYYTNGPWRISWVRYGYDPRLDPKARIYQTLDYRIRTGESSKLKVNPKRSYTSRTAFNLGPDPAKKVSLKGDMSTKPKLDLDERCYVLRPYTIPPARQMFYQFCDLILPEIQDRISRLPETSERTCDPKSGWLPKNFIEDCREIVNNYVLQAVQRELLEDHKMLQEKAMKHKEEQKVKETPSSSALDYCNQMLSSIKKGTCQNMDNKLSGPTQRDVETMGDDIEMIDLSDDEDEEYTVGDIIQNSIPERMVDQEEDDEEDNESLEEAEIDMDAVEEIKQMMSQTKTPGDS